jgi:EAL domain-containing protein (putative c-di-GMP-specific phosphodiesterase class I)
MMQQLVNIPANELKIDRAFVKNMHANSSDRVMVEKTIEIGHELGMSVTAEGVETETQPSFLRGKGRDRAQGFLFSRPLAPRRHDQVAQRSPCAQRARPKARGP